MILTSRMDAARTKPVRQKSAKLLLLNTAILIALSSFSAPCFSSNGQVIQSVGVLSATAPQKDTPAIYGRWYVGLGGGELSSSLDSSTSINNNSGAPAPFNQDVYSANNKQQPAITLSAGRRWERQNKWFPAFSAGLFYQHAFSRNIGGTIMQYSDPTFTNYNYNLNLSSDLLLASLKLNIINLNHFSPYLLGGVGGSSIHTSGYTESPLSGVNAPRISAGFASHTTSQFAYNVGAGIDYQVAQQFILSAEYQYQHFGNINSGTGSGSWAGSSLNLGSYHSNAVLVNLSYLFGK